MKGSLYSVKVNSEPKIAAEHSGIVVFLVHVLDNTGGPALVVM